MMNGAGGRVPGRTTAPGWRQRFERRRAPLVATAALLVVGMNWSIWWNPLVHHINGVWLDPADQWGTLIGAIDLVHGHFGAIYSPSTGLVTFPGILVLLAPVAAVFDPLHLEMGHNIAAFAAPTGWVLVGPYEMLLSSVALFGADALAERMGIAGWRRYALALVGAAALANVVVRWGHPEDAVAVGLVLYAALEADRRRWSRCGWLLGAAVAVQPVAILALGALVAGAGWRRLGRMVPSLVLPSLVVLAPPLAANWHGTLHVLVDQPNYPDFDHLTPWTSLLPRLHQKIVAVPAGPGRAVATVVAVVAGYLACRRRPVLELMLWMSALGFLLRVVGESVLDSFYLWPVLAVGLVLAAGRARWRFGAVMALALFLSIFANRHLPGVWPWWGTVVGSLVAVLALSWPGPLPNVAPDTTADRPGTDRPVSQQPPPGRQERGWLPEGQAPPTPSTGPRPAGVPG